MDQAELSALDPVLVLKIFRRLTEGNTQIKLHLLCVRKEVTRRFIRVRRHSSPNEASAHSLAGRHEKK